MTRTTKEELTDRIERLKAAIRVLDNEVYLLYLELKENEEE